MVRVLGLAKGYTPVKIHMPDDNKLKVNIRTDLLKSAGKEIIGTLHINGAMIYIPNNTQIVIGSSPECAIRIKDPAVGGIHARLLAEGGEISIEHMYSLGKTAVADIATKEVKVLSSQDERISLSNDSKIGFALSGTKGHLIIDLRLRKPSEEALKEVLIQELQPRPRIKQLSPAQALVRQESQAVSVVDIPIGSEIVKGTIFSKANSLRDVMDIVHQKKVALYKIGSGKRINRSIPIICALVSAIIPLTVNVSAAIIISICCGIFGYIGGLAILSTVFWNTSVDDWIAHKGLKRTYCRVIAKFIKKLDNDQVSEMLDRLDEGEKELYFSLMPRKRAFEIIKMKLERENLSANQGEAQVSPPAQAESKALPKPKAE